MHTPLKNQMSGKTQQQVSIFFCFSTQILCNPPPPPPSPGVWGMEFHSWCALECLWQRLGEKEQIVSKLELPMCNSALEKGSASGEAQGLMKEGQAVYPFKIYGK